MKKYTICLLMASILISIAVFPMRSDAMANRSGISQMTENESMEIEAFIDKLMKEGNIPGLSLTIVKGGQTIYQMGIGYSDLENRIPVTNQTLFELSSNSKAFTALGILSLEKEGLIELDDPVSDYIPWLEVKYQGEAADITIEQLLHHTSGIPVSTIDKIPVSNDEDALEKTVRTLINTKLDQEPGKVFQYATINYDVLGYIIEKVTGITYEQFMEEYVIQPLGLYGTYLMKDGSVSQDMAQGYKMNFLKPRLYNAPVYRGNKPAGYLMSNSSDMAEWLKIQMGTGEESVFDKDIIADSHTAEDKDSNSGSFYTAGWFVNEQEEVIYHGGENPNYSSFIIFDPNKKMGVAVLSNVRSAYVTAIGDGIYGMLQGREYPSDIRDLNKSSDILAVCLIGIAGFVLLAALCITVRIIRQLLRKERTYQRKSKKGFLKMFLIFAMTAGVTCCIYFIPKMFGISWNFIHVWQPESIIIAAGLAAASIWAVYLSYFIAGLFQKSVSKTE